MGAANHSAGHDLLCQAGYTQTITPQPPPPPDPRKTTAIVIFWLSLAIVFAGVVGFWSNHFSSGFHMDDARAIVSNPAIRTLTSIPKFFVDPRLFSSDRAHASWQPLLSTVFTLDYVIRGRADVLLFQLQTFLWFCLELGLIYLLFRLVPGGKHYSALFAAALFGLHPIAANTINDPLQLGPVLGAIGVLAGLSIALVWPHRLPAQISLGAPRVPKNEWDLFRIRWQPKVSRWYNHIRKVRLGLYMIPVGLGLLAFPATAIFAPLLAIYMILFEPAKPLRRVVYPAMVCGAWWLLQVLLLWIHAANSHVSLLDYWLTQPLVVLRSLWFFLAPFRLGGISTLLPVEHFWSPWAIAGDVGTAALIFLALRLGRLAEWRAVAFGIWWFLVALVPFAFVPEQQVETFPRLFFASIGLTLALSRTLLLLGARLKERKWGGLSLELPALGLGLVVSLTVLGLLGQETYRLNDVWKSDDSLWKDMVQRYPNDPVALMRHAVLIMGSNEQDFFDIRLDEAYTDLKRAVQLLPRSPEPLTWLAEASSRKRLEADAGKQLQDAMRLDPSYAPAYASYARWLLDRGRLHEAMAMARKAVELDPSNLPGFQAIADTYLAQPDWKDAIPAAEQVLRIDPDSRDGQRALEVAQAGLAARTTAETAAASQPSVDNYLALSAVYYQEKRYEDCIRAAQQALKIQPNLAEAYVNMATAYHALGKTDDGIAALREAARLRPDMEVVRNNLAWELAHKGEPDSN